MSDSVRQGLRVASLALFFATAVPAANAEPTAVDQIRVSSDGAGPSHLFWLASASDGTADIIGIIDPLFSAVRIYSIRTTESSAVPLSSRMTKVGACALPVALRPWRIHHLKQTVAIESMPEPGAAGFTTTADAMRTHIYTISRNIVATAPARVAEAGRQIDTTAWDPASAQQCGSLAGEAGRIGAGMPERARRGQNNPARTIILTNTAEALAPAAELIVRSNAVGQYRLISARELEPTPSFRAVQISEALPTSDGVLRIRQRVLTFSGPTGEATRQFTFDDTLMRSKLGLKPLAVMPTGELLAMGKDFTTASNPKFKLFSCGLLQSPSRSPASPICSNDGDAVAGHQEVDREPVPQPDLPAQPDDRGPASRRNLSARSIFEAARPLADYVLRVDASHMPEECRSILGCPVTDQPGLNFVPIRGIRLTRGTFERRGVPYAQADIPDDVVRLTHTSPETFAAALTRAPDGVHDVPGNLQDGLKGDLGIDCSGLVQLAFDGGSERSRLDTLEIQNFETDLLCSERLPGADYLRPGDIINLNVKQINHVVLFASALRLDGANDVWLTLEASSACDGVCWSVYDPSYFNGWGLYRASGRRDAPCIRSRGGAASNSIPRDMTQWEELVKSGGP